MMIDHGVDVQVWIFHSTRFHLRIRVSCTFQKEGTCWSNLNKRLTSLKKMDHWLEMEDDHCHIKSPNSNWRGYIPKTLKKLGQRTFMYPIPVLTLTHPTLLITPLPVLYPYLFITVTPLQIFLLLGVMLLVNELTMLVPMPSHRVETQRIPGGRSWH